MDGSIPIIIHIYGQRSRRHDKILIMATRDQQRLITGVVTGQIGIGKSTLINNILSKDVTGNDRAKMSYVVTNLERGTSEVQRFDGNRVSGFNLKIFDTPGWSDIGTKSLSDAQIVEDICKMTEGKVDFLYYCVSGRENVTSTDRKIFKLLTSNFTKKIWNHTIFVITFCNEMHESPNEFEEKIVSYRDDIRKALFHCDIPYDETTNILVVPAGDKSLCIWQQGGRRNNWREYLIEETCERIDSTSTLLKRKKCTIS